MKIKAITLNILKKEGIMLKIVLRWVLPHEISIKTILIMIYMLKFCIREALLHRNLIYSDLLCTIKKIISWSNSQKCKLY